jgi:monoamine oxidase
VSLSRRDLLRRGALVGLGLAAPSWPTRLVASPPRRILVLGAGLAGLTAAWELVKAGHEVTVLEAQTRAGGRVRTLRAPFADGLTAEAGASRIPDDHHLTLRYVREFGLELDPLPGDQPIVWHLRGQRLRARRGEPIAWPLALSPEEARLGLTGLEARHLGPAVARVGDPTAPGWPAEGLLEALDTMTYTQFLRSGGLTAEAVELLTLGFDLTGESALFELGFQALMASIRSYFRIRGGNDLLPAAFAARLGDRVRYGAAAVRIGQDERGVEVTIERGGERETLRADRLVCAIPFPVLRGIAVEAGFSAEKRRAIEGLGGCAVTKVFLQARRRFWADEGPTGLELAYTDLPIQRLWDATSNQPGPRGILHSYALGLAAAAERDDRLASAVDQVATIYPGARALLEGGVEVSWHKDPWARGAFAWYEVGQMRSLYPHVARPDGRVHFAGEHTSPWTSWMQGAIESGLRVAREIDGTVPAGAA